MASETTVERIGSTQHASDHSMLNHEKDLHRAQLRQRTRKTATASLGLKESLNKISRPLLQALSSSLPRGTKQKRVQQKVQHKRAQPPAWLHTLSPFEYEELDTRKKRFLRIPPPSDSGVAQFELLHKGHRETTYLALSYVWGNQLPSVPIMVNNKRLMIRPNLADFLWYAQNNLAGNLIWIDAICIDQQNDIEKGHQVRYMREIYSGARHVIAWISTKTVSGQIRRDTVRMIAEAASVSRSSLDLYEGQHLIGLALEKLLTNAYWARIWIVQEIWLARRVQLLWQGTEVQWSYLQRLVEAARFSIQEKLFATPVSWRGESGVRYTDYMKDRRGQVDETDIPWGLTEAAWQMLFKEHLTFDALSPIISVLEGPRSTFDRALQRRQDRTFQAADVERRYPLPDLIYEYSSHQATDARDKVYALLSLAEDGDKFKVDYGENTRRLAWRVTRFIYPNMSNDSAVVMYKEIADYLGVSVTT
jgi:hypothetical protein